MAGSVEAPAAGLLNLEKELVCFICTEVLFQPLTLIDCLHTFCGSCLKEWFSHQHKKATQSRSQSTSNPYTCPTCRASVKDARHNATVTTLLDMFLTANPSKGRAEDEKEEMTKIYKPGESILPRVETRRRDRRERPHDEAAEVYERRMIEEARERSLRELRSGNGGGSERLATPHGYHEQSRSRDREDRRRREQDRAERRRRTDAAEVALVQGNATNQSSRPTNAADLSPPTTSPRHPDAVEARQRERTVAHQASLRSLVSASESGTGTGDSLDEARIMQEILAEGLLDGINVDELTEAEQDELSVRIAQMYRQRHPSRDEQSPPQSLPPPIPETQAVVAAPNTRPEAAERYQRQRSRSSQPAAHEGSRREVIGGPQRTGPSERADSLHPPSEPRTHRRRASDESRGQTSSSQVSDRGVPAQPVQNPATRSASDLSNRIGLSETQPTERLRRLSNERRTSTEPIPALPRASELWRQQGGVDSNRSQTASRRRTDSPSRTSQTSDSPRPQMATIQSAVEQTPLTLPPVQSALHSEPLTNLASTHPQRPAPPPPAQEPTLFEEPSVSCARCSRRNIQYDVYKHCSHCDTNLCVRCYRAARGCNHWFGFGRAAMAKFEGSAPKRSSKLLEPPHVLIGRQYGRPAEDSITSTEIDQITKTAITLMTRSDPASRLEDGHFCDRCGTFANACFWKCDYCNDGEWGFCNDCVDTHRCCTHPLLPVARRATLLTTTPPSSDYDTRQNQSTLAASNLSSGLAGTTPNLSRPSTSHSSNWERDDLDYDHLSITSDCDMCGQPIPPSHSRYHCPSHLSSTANHNLGGYDVCTVCYHNLARSGHIKRSDGPAGWRKCPNGHRMIVVVFEMDSQGNQRRVIVNDLVGGWKCTDEDIANWNVPTSTEPAQSFNASQLAGRWSWREDSSGTRKSRTRKDTLLSQSQQQAQSAAFPPDGGFGKRCVGLWSYYPEEGEDGKGELLFPKGAEVCEVEDVNGEWWDGVYCGERGVFPAVFVREV